MTIEKKLLGTSPSGPAADVAEVFSTYVYQGSSTSQSPITRTINNGIDLAGEGGLVWIKNRSRAVSHQLYDTERGALKGLYTDSTSSQQTYSNTLTSFVSNGFTLGADGSNGVNLSIDKYASFTFRKKEKFFDVVTWTGDSVPNRKIAHNLKHEVGLMFIKRTDGARDWSVYHKDVGPTKILKLNLTDAAAADDWIKNTAPSSTEINIGDDSRTNSSGQTYVAYLFADNSSEDAEEQMIKCGSYTGTAADLSINLGWEPQFLLIKNTTSTADWYMVDTMRGFTATSLTNEHLSPNSSNAEAKVGNVAYDKFLNSTGFNLKANASEFNTNNQTYIYMAIRSEMMVEPSADSATDVFRVGTVGDTISGQAYLGHPADFYMEPNITGNGNSPSLSARLTGPNHMFSSATTAEGSVGLAWDSMTGMVRGFTSTDYMTYMWKRAKGYMDVVCYSGASSASTVPHSLSVIPEMIWTKYRNGAVNWAVYHSGIGNTKHLVLNDVSAQIGGINYWNNTTPTDTHFTVGTDGETGHHAGIYIAYLFATLDGISKVGSFVGNGSSQTISCGFSAGSRYILIKRTDALGDWYVWDSVRGIVAGNDPHLSLNTTAAQVTTDDSVDPHNAGFIVNQVSATNINVSSGTYIFYAIA